MKTDYNNIQLDGQLNDLISNLFLHVINDATDKNMEMVKNTAISTSASIDSDFDDTSDVFECYTIGDKIFYTLKNTSENTSKDSSEYEQLCKDMKTLANIVLEELQKDESDDIVNEECGSSYCQEEEDKEYNELEMSYYELYDFVIASLDRIEYLEKKTSSYEEDINYLQKYIEDENAERESMNNEIAYLNNHITQILNEYNTLANKYNKIVSLVNN